MESCIVGMRRHENSLSKLKDTPSIWAPSLAFLAAILSDDNRSLLRLPHDNNLSPLLS